MRNFVIIFFGIAIAYSVLNQPELVIEPVPTPANLSSPSQAPVSSTPDAQWRSGQQVRGSGVVSGVLPDDNDGSRHQRFIVTLDSGRTVLVAHNIDLAPRVSPLSEGDSVSFFGEYEPNSQGGVIHWTHKDPRGDHVAGWIEHGGQRYQ
jgi:hypothetical protein